MEERDYKKLANDLIEWFSVGENYSIVHFAIEHGLSKEELFRVAGENSELQDAVDYGLSVQEYKVMEGGMRGILEKSVVLKMLETYNGWKGDINLVQRNEYKQFMNAASEKAKQILSQTSEVGDDVRDKVIGDEVTDDGVGDDVGDGVSDDGYGGR